MIYRNHSMGRISVGMPGEHNALNALAATAVGLELDLEMKVIRRGSPPRRPCQTSSDQRRKKRGFVYG